MDNWSVLWLRGNNRKSRWWPLVKRHNWCVYKSGFGPSQGPSSGAFNAVLRELTCCRACAQINNYRWGATMLITCTRWSGIYFGLELVHISVLDAGSKFRVFIYILLCYWLHSCIWCTLDISSLFSQELTKTAHTVYPKKYAHGFCFAVLCCGYTLTDFPISIRLTSLALWQSDDCPSASKATLMNMDKYFIWIHYERLHNHNKAKHNKTVCIFLGIYCSSPMGVSYGLSLVSTEHDQHPTYVIA